MSRNTKKSLIKNVIEFVKLQLAGNVLFWGGLGGTALFKEVFGFSSLWALAIGNILAYAAFFVVDKNWVFSDKTGKQKTREEVMRFVIFMGVNYAINIVLVELCTSATGLNVYWSQFVVSTVFFTFWSWLGLKFWVFRHGRHARHHAITIETRKTNDKRHAKYKRLASKQKAKRTTRVY